MLLLLLILEENYTKVIMKMTILLYFFYFVYFVHLIGKFILNILS
jgi:hypothetical protein